MALTEMTPAQQHLENLTDYYEQAAAEAEDAGENMELVTYIQLSRIYDVGLAILRELNSDAADSLREFHSRGVFIGPDPALAAEDGTTT